MKTHLTIVARIEAQPGKTEMLKAALQRLVAPTLKESGCVQYDLHQDNENAAVFLFYENWESRELWQAHMKSAHLAEFLRATDGAVASIAIHEMTSV